LERDNANIGSSHGTSESDTQVPVSLFIIIDVSK